MSINGAELDFEQTLWAGANPDRLIAVTASVCDTRIRYEMPIPTYDKCMAPLLKYASDGKAHHIRDAIEALAPYSGLTEAERSERIPVCKKFKFDDRVQWANTYLKKAGLFASAGKGLFQMLS